ncbi:MAG: DUF1549 and DUF1553 domain-containing protein [Pirellulales bacterium]|nr:DUF1549 and DUF1553 domain-containing protein [Pirellulales bacterium]
MRGALSVVLLAFAITISGQAFADSSRTAADVAAEIDGLLQKEIPALATAEKPAPASDEVFLRRVYLDLVGESPRPAEVTAFALNPSASKRAEVVKKLLADERYGLNWARYWRDVILYRRSDDRALITAPALTQHLTEQFNAGASWRQIAIDFVTAEGDLATDGRTALLASQWGTIPETAAEVSRVLMGVQIQCAQCHDHKTDRWKREQFHQLAAFFPRIAIRPVREEGKRIGFELLARDEAAGQRQNKKGNKKAPPRFEHYMPDLGDPTAQGALMQPVFFVTGQKLKPGLTDEQRRQALANWIVSERNPWFARSVVNRLWAELLGEGLYEPVDDLGPDRVCAAPQTMDLLAVQLAAHDYDLRWLLETIATTELYSRQSRPRRQSNETPFVATCPQPLRADQLFNNLVAALGVEDEQPEAKPGDRAALIRRARVPRGQFNAAFGFDPSAPRDELAGSIEQALVMMNSQPVARAMSGGKQKTMLADLLRDSKNDDDVTLELYLRCLGREPSDQELTTCRDYLNEVGDRREAFEDILWSLINSTEFLYRR